MAITKNTFRSPGLAFFKLSALLLSIFGSFYPIFGYPITQINTAINVLLVWSIMLENDGMILTCTSLMTIGYGLHWIDTTSAVIYKHESALNFFYLVLLETAWIWCLWRYFTMLRERKVTLCQRARYPCWRCVQQPMEKCKTKKPAVQYDY